MDLSISFIQSKIFVIRGVKVMLDFDLAGMYGTDTSQLKRQVRRNMDRFPEDFMFELSKSESNALIDNIRCQNGILSKSWFRYPPFAFTVLGVLMLPNVLQSKKAIDTSVLIVRAFNAMANVILNPPPINEVHELQNEVMELKQHIEESFTDYNEINEDTRAELDSINEKLSVANMQFSEIYQALIELADQKSEFEKPRKQIGFMRDE
jgi:hypothetical protein